MSTSYIGVVGHIGGQIHLWQRFKSWKEVCYWLQQWSEVLKSLKDKTGIELPGHIFDSNHTKHVLGQDGLPIYDKPCTNNQTIIAASTKLPIPMYLSESLVVTLGMPGSSLYAWERIRDWDEACQWLLEIDTIAKELKISKDLPNGHILPETFAAIIRNKEGLPIYPKSSIQKAQVQIFN